MADKSITTRSIDTITRQSTWRQYVALDDLITYLREAATQEIPGSNIHIYLLEPVGRLASMKEVPK